ncbi:MAG: hypothetical protein ACK47D_14275 [Pseudanabaena sp.]|uniref:hypothetical protein n=1 Tax=Cyanophyceae TaxID=3028117 RepID=UPI00257678DB|nr:MULTISPECIES: hypothetical protein [Cyanophyceae]MCA3065748.1 hypothetical protein [Rhodocyclaceae bacterium]MCA6575650.1 hypothetical protein [Pseudanabaena sp. M53BS1SP1A06MG]MCA6588944.1 hypothetical protein [Pseudanabaena sp. M109S1SP1A06QC]MCA6614878.1 hypothetical protein [Pseudanabaena sp. M090S1SP1A06QC]MCA2584413.1 hypothetical protein [Microcystis sp. M34BS1]
MTEKAKNSYLTPSSKMPLVVLWLGFMVLVGMVIVFGVQPTLPIGAYVPETRPVRDPRNFDPIADAPAVLDFAGACVE